MRVPCARRYCLRQDRIILAPCVQAALDPVALFEQAGLPCSDAGDALLVNRPGRFDFKLGLICKTLAGDACARSGAPRPKHMGLFWPSNPRSPIRILLEGKALVSVIRILYRMRLSAVNFSTPVANRAGARGHPA